MGFEYGVITDLNYTITLYCFFFMIAFVILFEYVIGVMEYFLGGSKLYTQIIQMIYKELMMMGLVTFSVVLYEAVPNRTASTTEHEWIVGIDFSHIFLFFVALFFVLHAFYLMFMAMMSASRYRKIFAEKTVELIHKLETVKMDHFRTNLFNLKFLPLSNARISAEFNLIHSVFTNTYSLPDDFDFPNYLSGCFDSFALRTINRSILTWCVLLFVILVNFGRISLGLSCHVSTTDDGTSHRRNLGSTTTESHEDDGGDTVNSCLKSTLDTFLGCGYLLVVYTLILTYVTRIYKLRSKLQVY